MTDPGSAAEPRWMVPRGLIVVLAVTGLLVSGMALQQFASILGPVLLALIPAIGVHSLDLHPLRSGLAARPSLHQDSNRRLAR